MAPISSTCFLTTAWWQEATFATKIVPQMLLNPRRGTSQIYFHNLQLEKTHVFSKVVTWNSSHPGPFWFYFHGTVANAIHYRNYLHGDLKRRERGVPFLANVFSPPTQRMMESCYFDYYFMSWWNIRNKLKLVSYGLCSLLNLGANRGKVGVPVWLGVWSWAASGPQGHGCCPKNNSTFFSLEKNSGHTMCLTSSSGPSSPQFSSSHWSSGLFAIKCKKSIVIIWI